MADPFEILQNNMVDVPQMLGLAMQAKRARLQDLYLQRQINREESKAKQEAMERDAYRGLFEMGTGPGSVATGVGAPPTAPQEAHGRDRRVGRIFYLMKPSGAAIDPSGETQAAPGLAAAPADAAAPGPGMPQDLTAGIMQQPEGSPDAAGAAPAGGVLRLNPNGLRKLAGLNPKLALTLQQMDGEQLKAAYDRIESAMDLTARVVNGVSQHPPADRPAVYARIRDDLRRQGVPNLPDEWDEQAAKGHMTMGLTMMQAFQNDRADRRFAWDRQDDEADNERADRDVDSRVDDRGERRRLTARGQDIRSSDTRRGQDQRTADVRRGQDMLDARSKRRGRGGAKSVAPVQVKTVEEARSLPPGTVFVTPDGRQKVR